LTQLGEFSLWIALLMAAWCTTLSIQGALLRRAQLATSGARGLYAAFFFLIVAATALAGAFVLDDYSLRYVAMHSGRGVELLYKLCAFWSDRAGESLLASLLFAFAGSVAAKHVRRVDTDRARAAWTVAAIGLMLVAILAATAFGANPFAHLPRTPGDGRGLDPMLRNVAMLVQPPLMLFGAAGAAVTLALVIGAACRWNFDRALFTRLRSSAAESWGFLSAAFLIGAHWAYVSPGLRGLMMKNPAVIASAIVWLVLSVFLVAVELTHAIRGPHADADVMRRRAGRILAAFGVVLCVGVFAARPLTKNYDVQIGDGEQYRAKDAWGHEWTFTSQGASRLERFGDDVTSVALLPERDRIRQPYIASESRQYYGAGGLDIFPPQAVPGIRSTIAQDLFVALSDAGEGRSVLRISFIPLVELAWVGGVFLALGGLLLFWPPKMEFAT
jgi:cytochrome c biogenesis factor